MTNKVILLLAGAALTVAGCAKHNDTNTAAGMDTTANSDMTATADNGTMADNGAMAANMAAPAAAPLTAQAFANAAAASDHFEVESSKLAAAQASSAKVKSFAKQMISAHTASTAKLKGIAAKLSPAITPDDTLNADQQAALDSLKGQKGAAFDSAYASAQVDGHQKTLDALKAYAASGDNAQLKGFATDLIPIVIAHLNMAKGLK
jgi:putative membrane protein